MSDASQVRINELARELEVKAKAIIDLLPGFGVTEKKTHSSSITVEVAEKVRHHLKGIADAEAAADAERAAKEAAAKAAQRRPVLHAATAAPAKPAARQRCTCSTCTCGTCARSPSGGGSRCAESSSYGAGAPAPAAPVARPAPPAAPTAAPGPVAVKPAAPAVVPAPAAAPKQAHPPRPAAPANRQHSSSSCGHHRTFSPARHATHGSAPAAAAPGAPARTQVPSRPMPTGNRGPVPGTVPGSGQRPSGPRPGQPMRPQQSGQGGRPHTSRTGGPVDRAEQAVRLVRDLARCRRDRVPAHARPAGQGCCRHFQKRCR